MKTLNPEQTVASLVLERPARSRVFEALGIDYCCGGKRTLQEACTRRHLSVDEVLQRLALDDSCDTAEPRNPAALGLSALIGDILESHHEYLRGELPRLHRMLEKVSRVHGDKDPRLAQMFAVFAAFQGELEAHMMKEERILFPAIAHMDQYKSRPQTCFASIAQPIAQMEHEHDGAGDALAALRQLSDGFTPPAWACNTYRALLDGLHELEQNMHAHVHKENNILFPRALELERLLNN